MKNIIVAGATGYLGSHIVKLLQSQEKSFKAIARNKQKLLNFGLDESQIITAEVTKSETLQGILENADVVISSVGITRQKDGLTYMDVDYQANINLLEEAKRAGVQKFIYISAVNGDKMRHLKIMAAKEKFVDTLKTSGLAYTVFRPNGFFSDMKDFLEMAKSGTVYLFGDGNFKLNPIHGADLAKAIIESIEENETEIPVGGPDLLTQNEIGEIALQAWKKPIKIMHLPDWIRKFLIFLLRTFTSSKTYGPFEFFLTLMAQDNITPRYGQYRLKTFFEKEVDQIKS
ncbi:MAG: NAD-dependent dehydratase [Thalassobius sp.]|nr:NAD-dependent dehydratase [Thalassovita sp.]